MSGKLIGEVYERVLGHAEQAVLIAMADHAQDDGSDCYPSVPRIAWKTGYTDRQVQRIMARLREWGALVVSSEASRYRPTGYTIVLDALPLKPPPKGAKAARPGVTSEPARGDIEHEPGVTFETARGDISVPRGDIHGSTGVTFQPARGDIAVAPEPEEEPEEEPSMEPSMGTPEALAADAAAPGGASETFTAQVAPALVQATGFRGTVAGGKPAAWLGQCLGILGEATGNDPSAALALIERIRSGGRWQYRKRSTAQFPDWLRSMVADLKPAATSEADRNAKYAGWLR